MTEEIIAEPLEEESVEETLKDLRKSDLEHLAQAVKYHYDISIACKRKIDDSKTKTKKLYYNKKMVKNNKILANLLSLYENMKNLEENDATSHTEKS